MVRTHFPFLNSLAFGGEVFNILLSVHVVIFVVFFVSAPLYA